MPIYEYHCPHCKGYTVEVRRIADRDILPYCFICQTTMERRITAPAVRVIGRADGKVVGGPDQFTADALGYKLKDLPQHLKTGGSK